MMLLTLVPLTFADLVAVAHEPFLVGVVVVVG